MTDLTREQIEALLKDTTPGDWSVATDPCHYDTASDVVCGKNLHASVGGKAGWREQEANTRIMAAATNLARQLLATMTERDEAQAAQAGAVERCANEAAGEVAAHGEAVLAPFIRRRIRSLADPTGVKLLDELRQREANLALHAANLADQLAEAQKREAGYQEALIWCSGSDDFQADGKARAGWLKLCAPLIDRAALTS